MPSYEQLSKFMSLGVSPMVTISASGLLCLGFFNRYAAIVARLRAFQKELLTAVQNQRLRIETLKGSGSSTAAKQTEKLTQRKEENIELLSQDEHGGGVDTTLARQEQDVIDMIHEQIRIIKLRAKIIKSVLMCLLSNIFCMAATCLLNGLAALHEDASIAGVVVFVIGLCLILVAMALAIAEIVLSLKSVQCENRFVEKQYCEELQALRRVHIV